MTSLYTQAYLQAHQDLRQCYTESGIVAGVHHFVDLWARDSLFASLGSLAVGEYEVVKTTLLSFLIHQRKDGFLPYRISRSPLSFAKYRGRPSFYSKIRPNFRSFSTGGLVQDGGLMTIIAFDNYILHSGDWGFLKTHYNLLKLAIDWYAQTYRRKLVWEWFLCEWADAVLKAGKTLYTNILYAAALKSMVSLSDRLGQKDDAITYKKQALYVTEEITRQFWNGSYLIDWIDWRPHTYLPTHANLLAIYFGIVSERQARSIMNTIETYCLSDFTVETNYPKYAPWRIPLASYAVGMADYHNRGCLWLQPGILYILGQAKYGDPKKAKTLFHNMTCQIVRYNGVYEVYERGGNPLKRLLYTSEHPFAWSSGLYVLAAKTLNTKIT